MEKKRLSESIADTLLSMITIEKRFCPGDKIPNENDLSAELNVSRTTLREAIRILVTRGVLEIDRGKGTFVKSDMMIDDNGEFETLAGSKVNLKDLYEMRLIFEPEAVYLATMRAGDEEIRHIIELGKRIELNIAKKENRTNTERAFHKAIAKATHNEFMDKLMPVIYKAIDQGVILSKRKEKAVEATVQDHKMIMEFMESRNAEGAKHAMKIHILHAIKDLEL